MGTTAQVFYAKAAGTDWDGTDPASGDVRKVETTADADSTSSSNAVCAFGTAAASIVVDPFTSRSTTGTGDQDKFGWAVNVDGSDGMEGTATAKRLIPAGAWSFVTCLTGTATSNYTVQAHVYRISADGTTRALLFSSNESSQAIPTASRALWSFSSASQPEYTFADDESVLISYTVRKVSSSVSGENIAFSVGRALVGVSQTNLCTVTLPTPGVRTQYQETITVDAIGTATVTDGTLTVTGTVRDSNGDPVDAATAKLFDQSTDTRISTYTTGADGTYTFTRADDDTATYYVVGHSGDTLHGTSDRGLTAT